MDEGVPVIRGRNLTDDLVPFVPSGFAFVSVDRAQSYKAQHVRAGDLVFTCWGTVGQVGRIPQDGPYPEYIISNKQLKLRPDPARTDSRFLYYYFASPQMVEHIKGRAIGSAVPGINLGILKALPVVLPPLPTQRKIAAILSAYDDLIENNNRRIKLLEDMAQRIYREWFVDFRYPGHKSVPLVESEFGSIPAGWEVIPLSEVAEATRGLSWDRDQEVTNGGLPVITIPNVQERLRLSNMTQLSGVSDHDAHRFSVRSGDIILVGSNGNPERVGNAIRVPPDVTVLLASFLMRVRVADAATSSALLYMQLTDRRLTDQWKSAAIGSTSLRNLRLSALRSSLVLKPEPTIERLAHRHLEPWLALQDKLDLQSVNLRATRDLLLPRLISGEVEVAEAA